MKKLTYLILILSVLGFASCGTSGTKKENSAQKEEEKSDEIMNCDDFLANYEEWIDEYLIVIENYVKDPVNETLAEQFMELMQEGMEWSTRWLALADCADNNEYEQKFEEISKKVEDKLKELGIE